MITIIKIRMVHLVARIKEAITNGVTMVEQETTMVIKIIKETVAIVEAMGMETRMAITSGISRIIIITTITVDGGITINSNGNNTKMMMTQQLISCSIIMGDNLDLEEESLFHRQRVDNSQVAVANLVILIQLNQ